jgi:DNA repair exonuclease SbcCD ATPase subunit
MNLKEMLGEELYGQVKEKLEDDTELIINDGSYLPRTKLNEKTEEIDNLKEQRDHYKEMAQDYESKLDDFSDLAEENEELQEQIESVKTEKEEIEEQFQGKLQEKDFSYKLDTALREAGARNPKAVKALLDLGEIKLENEDLKGLEAQLETIKKEEDHLFGETGLEGDDHKDGDGPVDDDIKNNPWEPGKVKLSKQAEILENNPGKAKKLIEKAGLNPGDYGLS